MSYLLSIIKVHLLTAYLVSFKILFPHDSELFSELDLLKYISIDWIMKHVTILVHDHNVIKFEKKVELLIFTQVTWRRDAIFLFNICLHIYIMIFRDGTTVQRQCTGFPFLPIPVCFMIWGSKLGTLFSLSPSPISRWGIVLVFLKLWGTKPLLWYI